MMRNLLLCSALVIAACGDETQDAGVCSSEEADINRVPTAIPPDWETTLNFGEDGLGKAQGLSSGEPHSRERIQAWDCLDLSWWTPAAPQKVVQIWTDSTECELFEHSAIEIYDCDSHDGTDDIYRDIDGDGFYATEGDCNDDNAVVSPEATEICDDVDNDCDGVADEYLDCSDIEAVGDGM